MRRPLPYWAVAGCIALLTALLVGNLAASAADARARWEPGAPVLVARRPVAAGATVSSADVEARRLPPAAVPEGALHRLPPGGRAAVDLHAGEVLLADRVGTGSAVAARLPARTRGVAVPADGGLPVRVGDRVDVLATFDAEVAGDAPTFAVARRALVVHVSKDAVTVAVSEASAPRVAYALAAGAVTLVLT
jgi:Flp pilus assembly protein CpaB